ncbi:uncharacterized protein [Montipora foliosa]|uniref:uncharacterized protein n=1 Tax=Montipora foliosa TaxID=591990 RepID=UPI0035F12D24
MTVQPTFCQQQPLTRKGNNDCQYKPKAYSEQESSTATDCTKRGSVPLQRKAKFEQLMIMRSDNQDNNEREKEQTTGHTNEGKEKDKIRKYLTKKRPVPTENLKVRSRVRRRQIENSSENCSSPKPLRRAQLRKKSIVEQRRRKSIAQRPNIEELENARGNKVEDSENVAENSSQRMAQEKAESENFENTRRHSGNATSARVFGQLREGNIGEGLKRERTLKVSLSITLKDTKRVNRWEMNPLYRQNMC